MHVYISCSSSTSFSILFLLILFLLILPLSILLLFDPSPLFGFSMPSQSHLPLSSSGTPRNSHRVKSSQAVSVGDRCSRRTTEFEIANLSDADSTKSKWVLRSLENPPMWRWDGKPTATRRPKLIPYEAPNRATIYEDAVKASFTFLVRRLAGSHKDSISLSSPFSSLLLSLAFKKPISVDTLNDDTAPHESGASSRRSSSSSHLSMTWEINLPFNTRVLQIHFVAKKSWSRKEKLANLNIGMACRVGQYPEQQASGIKTSVNERSPTCPQL